MLPDGDRAALAGWRLGHEALKSVSEAEIERSPCGKPGMASERRWQPGWFAYSSPRV